MTVTAIDYIKDLKKHTYFFTPHKGLVCLLPQENAKGGALDEEESEAALLALYFYLELYAEHASLQKRLRTYLDKKFNADMNGDKGVTDEAEKTLIASTEGKRKSTKFVHDLLTEFAKADDLITGAPDPSLKTPRNINTLVPVRRFSLHCKVSGKLKEDTMINRVVDIYCLRLSKAKQSVFRRAFNRARALFLKHRKLAEKFRTLQQDVENQSDSRPSPKLMLTFLFFYLDKFTHSKKLLNLVRDMLSVEYDDKKIPTTIGAFCNEFSHLNIDGGNGVIKCFIENMQAFASFDNRDLVAKTDSVENKEFANEFKTVQKQFHQQQSEIGAFRNVS